MMETYSNKRGFTLIELIVVITILSILAIVAFISVQSYSQNARNAVRLDAIGKIATVMDTEDNASSKTIMAYTFTGQEVPNASLQGTGTIVGGNYSAGEYNGRALNIVEEDFQDPYSGHKYVLGVTSFHEGQYEVAATLEEGWNQVSKVIGTYTSRQSEVIPGGGTSGDNKFILSDPTYIGSFQERDYLTGSNLPTNAQVKKISADGLTIYLTENFTGTSSGVQLMQDEVSGLILGVGTYNTPVPDGSGTYLPYILGGGFSYEYVCVFAVSSYEECSFGE